MNKPRLIAIVGPTASGKTALAVEVAKKYNGEIICADSRTVYRGMDLGTAKPTQEERSLVPHHLLDVVAPCERFTVADFQRLASEAIIDIGARGRVPIVVGGSGLYVDALLYGFALRPEGSISSNQALSDLSDDDLRERIRAEGIDLNPSDLQNRRRLERAVLAGFSEKQPRKLQENYAIIGLDPGIEVIEERIAARTSSWFEGSILAEAKELMKKYGLIEALNTPPYREIAAYLKEGCTLDETKQLINLHLRQLAKRQLTWFKRNSDIRWEITPSEAANLVQKIVSD